jgi:hypothetical protein
MDSRRIGALVGRAGGELALIVLGVTVALWADGWVSEREDRVVESVRVRALSENVQTTLERVREAGAEAASAVLALRYLSSLPSSGTTEEIERALLVGFFYVPVFNAELDVYDDLKNSGELSLLRDGSLRRALSSLDGALGQLRLYQQDVATVQQLNFDRYLIGRIDLRGILGSYLRLGRTPSEGGTDISFVQDLEFRNLVLFKLDLAEQMSRQFDRVEGASIAVQESIAAQL